MRYRLVRPEAGVVAGVDNTSSNVANKKVVTCAEGTDACDTDGLPNTDAQFWGAFSSNGGLSYTKNFQISAGTSNSRDAHNGIDYGDYTGLSFYGGIAHPVWADNSNSTGDNPDGTLHQFDLYTAKVSIP